MSETRPIAEVQDAVYTMPGAVRRRAYGTLAGAAALIGGAALGFLAALRMDVDMFQMQAMTTLPTVMAVFLIMMSMRQLRGPAEVRLTGGGIEVVDQRGRRGNWRWEEITLVKKDDEFGGQVLVLYGAGGKVLLKLPGGVERFAEMAGTIQARVAQNPAPAREQAKAGKSRRNGYVLLAGAAMAWLIGGANLWMAVTERATQKLLKEQGVAAVGVVTEKNIAPNGRTHRIVYRVDDPSGRSDTANVEVKPVLWQLLQVGAEVRIVVVPGRPDISRLAAGQVDDRMAPNPLLMIPMSIVFIVAGFVALGVGVLALKGKEIGLVDGRVTIRGVTG